MAHNTQIGKNLLEQLMFSLYSNAETIYREYLQNASDAIKDAEMQGILDEGDGHVTINIDKFHNRVVISDNGTGIPAAEAEARLKDIAKSSKRADYFAGFYGIGRLVGAGYCKTLSFKTSAKGENAASEMFYDVDKIREILADSSNDMGAAEVIDHVTTFISHIPEESDKHYFIVTLDGILPEYPSLLDEDAIHQYLLQVAPIEYSINFRNILINGSLQKTEQKFSDYYKNLPSVKVSLNDFVNIRKPYGLNVSGTGDEISCLRFFALTDSEMGDLSWGWYAITPFDRAIPDTDTETNSKVITRGIRIRSHNIQIGDESFFDGTEYFKQARSNKYFNGEINILHHNIKPNTARDGLANTREAIRLKELIKDFFNDELQKVYQNANKLKKEIERYDTARTEEAVLFHENGTDLTTEKQAQLDKIKKQKTDAEKAINTMLAKSDLASEGMQGVYKVYGNKFNDNKDKPVEMPDPHAPVSYPKTQSKKAKNDFDEELSSLAEKYGPEGVDLLKKVFNIMDSRYRNSEALIRGMKNSIIKDLKDL